MLTRSTLGTVMFVVLLLCVQTFGIDAAPSTGDLKVSHLSEETRVEVGASRMIAFHVSSPPAEATAFAVDISNDAILELVHPPLVGADTQTGFVRVRGLAAGRCRLTVDDATIDIIVKTPRHQGTDDVLPGITGPANGAVIWGEISVGVQTRMPRDLHGAEVVLELPDGSRLTALEDTGQTVPPYRQCRFLLDTDAYHGTLQVTPLLVAPDGRERRGLSSTFHVRHPDKESLTAGEAEWDYPIERPEQFQDARKSIGRDVQASGGAFFLNNGASPVQCFPMRVEDDGMYQLVVRAAGTRALGALPTIAVVVDGDTNNPRTNGRLLGEQWHRCSIGLPFALTKGTRIVSPYFGNDFYVPMSEDRNLFLDRIEVLRVGDTNGRAADENAMMMQTMNAMAAGPATATVADDPMGERPMPLRIGLTKPLEGRVIAGFTEVAARCWWNNVNTTPGPTVTLFVNDRPVETQISGAPTFWIDPAHFNAGTNTIELVAKDSSGNEVRTPVQHVERPDGAHVERTPRRGMRFSIHHPDWNDTVREHLGTQHYPKERRAAAFHANATGTLTLDDDLAGRYRVYLEARGDVYKEQPQAELAIEQDGKRTVISTINVPGWWNSVAGGEVTLEPGPKKLHVSFVNDFYEEGKGDRNLWFEAVRLTEQTDATDTHAPIVKLLYPQDGQIMAMHDMVVCDVADDILVERAELLIDGASQGIQKTVRLEDGRIAFPLLLRDMAIGEHNIAVQAFDQRGNIGQSAVRTVNVTTIDDADPTAYERAIVLLDRFAFGVDHRELVAILSMGEEAWLRDRLTRPLDSPGDLAALGTGLPFFVNRSNYETPRRALSHALCSPNPARTRFVFWAENHFNTWINKVQGTRKWEEHIAFARVGAAPFATLLLTSAQSPAMIHYLDQTTSFANRLNENYAREIMELHTLGVDGGYTQDDVTNLAHLLTGWSVSREGDGRSPGVQAADYTFRFAPRLNNGDAMTLLSHPFAKVKHAERFNRATMAIEMLAAHPNTAQFIATKLASHYLADPPPPNVVDSLSDTFVRTNGDMVEMLVAIMQHPSFWNETAHQRVAQPFDYVMRLHRTTNHYSPWRAGDFLNQCGFGLFDRATPDGYPQDDASYSDSNLTIQRWRLAQDTRWALVNLIPGPWRWREDIPETQWQQMVTDAVAVGITGRVLSEASNEAAMQVLTSFEGNREQRCQQLAIFVASLPEANLK